VLNNEKISTVVHAKDVNRNGVLFSLSIASVLSRYSESGSTYSLWCQGPCLELSTMPQCSVVDPDSVNPDPETDLNQAFPPVNPGSVYESKSRV
jgi:hypothetical protein